MTCIDCKQQCPFSTRKQCTTCSLQKIELIKNNKVKLTIAFKKFPRPVKTVDSWLNKITLRDIYKELR